MKEENKNWSNKDIALKIKANEPNYAAKKGSKRLERIQEAASSWGVNNFHQVTNEKTRRDLQKPQVSLKDIAFSGSNRKLSVLHPSRNNTYNLGLSNGLVKVAPQPISSGCKIPSNNNVEQNERENNNENCVSAENIENNQPHPSFHSEQHSELNFPTETKVGNKLNEEIQKNIISMILLILISIPLLNGDTWFDNMTSYQKGIEELSYFAGTSSTLYDKESKIFI